MFIRKEVALYNTVGHCSRLERLPYTQELCKTAAAQRQRQPSHPSERKQAYIAPTPHAPRHQRDVVVLINDAVWDVPDHGQQGILHSRFHVR